MDYKIIYQVKFFDFSITTYIMMFVSIILIGVMICTRNIIMKFKVKLGIIIVIIITSLFGIIDIVNNYTMVSALRSGDYSVVEGKIKNFVSGKSNEKYDESFLVNDVQFYYSHITVTGGFNKDNTVGGPMHDGMTVRISHVNGIIIKIEAK